MELSELSLKVWSREAIQANPYPSRLFPPSPYYRFLKVLAKELQPSLSVVLGVCGGGCCLHLAAGNPQGVVVGVDLEYDHPEQLAHIKQHCPNFVFWQGDSVKSAQEIYQKFGPVGILFVDTVHITQRTIDEFEAWKPYLSDNCVVAFDDLKRIEMNGFWDWLPENKLRLDDLHPTSEGGFGVWWK